MEVREEFKMALQTVFDYTKPEKEEIPSLIDAYIEKINKNNKYGVNLSIIKDILKENIPEEHKDKYAIDLKSSKEAEERGLNEDIVKAYNNAFILSAIPLYDLDMINVIKDYLVNASDKKEATKTVMLYLSLNYVYSNKINHQREFFDAVKQFSNDVKIKKLSPKYYFGFMESIGNWTQKINNDDNNINYYANYLNIMKYTYMQHKEENKFFKSYSDYLPDVLMVDIFSHYRSVNIPSNEENGSFVLFPSKDMKNSFKRLMYRIDEHKLETVPPITDGEYSIGFLSSFPEYRKIPLALGEIVNNCQVMGDAGETAMLHGVLNPNAGFVIIVDNKTGEIKAESEVFVQKKKDKNIFCFDSIEITHGLNPIPYEKLICKFVEERLVHYDNVYVGRGYRDPETNEYDKLPEHFLTAGAKDKKGIRPEITPFEAYLYSHEDDNENCYGVIDSVEEAENLLNEGTISSFDFLYTDIADNDDKDSDTKFAYQIKKNGKMLIDEDKLPTLSNNSLDNRNDDYEEDDYDEEDDDIW